jgi:sugar lactone lactonase YvrE
VSRLAGWIYAVFRRRQGFPAADDKMIYYKRFLKRLISILAVGLWVSVVNAQPVITQEPVSQLAPLGGAAMLRVVASGTGPLTYQWQHNGTNLPNDIITTVAGSGALGFSGDGGAATNAALASPSGVAVDGAGNLYIADYWNSVVREVDVNGIITTAAGLVTNGSVAWGYSGDGGAATNAELDAAISVATDAVGDLFIADYANNRIREVDASGIITTVAGNGAAGFSGNGGAAINATLTSPTAAVVDSAGNLFVADYGNNFIRKVDSHGTITIAAGAVTNVPGYSGDGGAATRARLNAPTCVAMDAAGDLLIADSNNNRIRKVNTRGKITTIAGNGTAGYSGDGAAATNAALDLPVWVVAGAAGELFISDKQRIRRVDSSGIITTVAGNGTVGYSGDGGAATNATFNSPGGITVDANNNLFIADTGNECIREVFLQGPVLALHDITTNDAGDYTVIVTSPSGCVTSSVVTLSLADLPLITVRPCGHTAFLGESTSLSVVAHCGLPMSYQWIFDSTNLVGQTNAVLTLPAISANNAGKYTVAISDVYGSVTSSPPAVLRVRAGGTINIMPMGDSVTARGGGLESSYRYWLYTYLTNAGFSNTLFVGSQTGNNGTSDGPPANSFAQMSYEGGANATDAPPVGDSWTTYDGANDATNAAGVLNKGNPAATIVLLDLGANDYEPGGPMASALSQVQTNLETIIQTFYQTNSKTVILLAVPTPWVINPLDATAKQFMSGLGSVIKKAASDQKKAGASIVMVNLRGGFNPSADTKDGTHPNLKGEQMIAKKYFNALRPILKKMEKEGL